MVSQEYMKSILEYDHVTGIFKWLVAKGGFVKKGMVAGRSYGKGYIGIHVDGKTYVSHRLAWVYIFGDNTLYESDQIDHINHDRTDNRIENLRIVDRSNNQRNRAKNKNNTSGFCGVTWNKANNRWQVQIMVKGKAKYLGSFKEKSCAISARKEGNKEYNFHANHGKTIESNKES